MITISELAERAGTSADTVRYYERIGVLPEARRSAANYRLYDADDVERLRFVRRAKDFGLQLEDIAELVRIRDDGLCPCGHARNLLTDKLDDIERQIAALEDLRTDIRGFLVGDAINGDGCWPCAPAPGSDDRTRS